MAKFPALLIGAAVAVLACTVTPVTAHAKETTPASAAAPDGFSAAAADGFLYAADLPYGQGDYCRWTGNDDDWTSCRDGGGNPRTMWNRASQMWNNGFPGGYDDVNLYYHRRQDGAYRCLPNGSHWDDLPLGRETFNRVGDTDGRDGLGQSLNNNVASHKWVTSC